MADVLFFRANFELATEYLYFWFGLGIESAEKLGYRVIDIGGAAATLDNLLDALEKYNFNAIFLGGHGNETTLTGQNYQQILKACVNDQVMSGNLAYLLSCYTGLELGPSMISKKTQAYVGYNRDFRFMINTDLSPQEDSMTSLAQPFQEIVLEIITRILKGQSMGEVYNGGILKCNEWIEKLFERREYQWGQVIEFLKHNRDALIALGKREVHATPPTPTSAPGSFIPFAASVGSGALLLALGMLM